VIKEINGLTVLPKTDTKEHTASIARLSFLTVQHNTNYNIPHWSCTCSCLS